MTAPTPEAIEAALKAAHGVKTMTAAITAALSAAAPHIQAAALRDAADEDDRIHLIGKTASGEITDQQRADYWARKELSTGDWLRDRAETIEGEKP